MDQKTEPSRLRWRSAATVKDQQVKGLGELTQQPDHWILLIPEYKSPIPDLLSGDPVQPIPVTFLGRTKSGEAD
jgi:hypothetical protein